LDYSRPDELKVRSANYIIYELAPSSVYSVAVRTRNGFGFSDWTAEFYFETAPGSTPCSYIAAPTIVDKNSET